MKYKSRVGVRISDVK